MTVGVDTRQRWEIARRGRRLQYVTITWNSAECVVALAAGFLAGSIALVGFGFDSAIEVTSSLAALWRLRSDAVERDRERAEGRTRSEEHTSELQSHVNLVCRLLLEKKKKKNKTNITATKIKQKKKV